MKNHLKGIAAPKTWNIARKANVFSVRPNPGAHALEWGLPLGFIIRDTLQLALTLAEASKILHRSEVLVDGVRRTDHRFIVGLFDVISIPPIQKYYRVVLDRKGRLAVVEIPPSESGIKLCKVRGKTALAAGKIQLNLYDGKNIISADPVNVGDSVVISLPTLKITQVLPLQPGALVFLTKGKHGGDLGTVKAITGKEAMYICKGTEIQTAKAYLYVVGTKEPLITVTLAPEQK